LAISNTAPSPNAPPLEVCPKEVAVGIGDQIALWLRVVGVETSLKATSVVKVAVMGPSQMNFV
jgi:hypothetical protein